MAFAKSAVNILLNGIKSKQTVQAVKSAQILNTRFYCCPQNEYTYEVTKDPKEWANVEVLIADPIVPPVPKFSDGDLPTPSGWIPPKDTAFTSWPYSVSRTKNHMLPVYLKQSNVTPVKFTQVGKISGDIWALDEALRAHLEEVDPDSSPILTQVHEPGRFIRIRGVYTDTVAQFLLDKGF
ncbi:large ribosomal subunit protein mL49-like isoform X2 [Watersipora subatra]|uniref:large ribosomal subunit protein mL49-like isoform X2 n=1 Tax=Watersipora subatra TaxID=2589382 RepID=UPI00355B8467